MNLFPRKATGSLLQAKSFAGGFTLIELLVVIAIIGLLAAIILGRLQQSRIKARDARRKSDLHGIQTVLAIYYDKFGNYPITDEGGGGGQGQGQGHGQGKQKNGKKKGTLSWQFSTDSDYWIGCNVCYEEEDPNSLREFLLGLPRDPLNNGPDPRLQGFYSYGYYSLTGEDYELIAQLENSTDQILCSSRCWLSHEQDPGKAWCPVCPNPKLNYSTSAKLRP